VQRANLSKPGGEPHRIGILHRSEAEVRLCDRCSANLEKGTSKRIPSNSCVPWTIVPFRVSSCLHSGMAPSPPAGCDPGARAAQRPTAASSTIASTSRRPYVGRAMRRSSVRFAALTMALRRFRRRRPATVGPRRYENGVCPMRRVFLVVGAAVGTALMSLASVPTAAANVALTRLSNDPYTNTSSQHRTEVEPDIFAFGTTVVTAFQVGRFTNGGSSNIGWATSADGGTTWRKGFLRGITTFAGGSYDRASDPAVAFDAAHQVWLISSLPLRSSVGAAIVVSRSTNGGTTWGTPVTVTAKSGVDKNWTVCDNMAASPYYGHCYTEWDDNSAGNVIYMSTSADGGVTWSVPVTTTNRATGIGGQPVVQGNGTVIVPIDDANENAVRAFVSTNGGVSWSAPVTVANITDHVVAGNLRSGPLVSAQIDGAGKVYVAWHDCRFESSCSANDIVLSTSTNGLTWSAVTRIPIDAVGSGVDHFLPGIGVDPATSGSTTHLALTYYFYPVSACSFSTCKLEVGFVSSADGGATWTAPKQLAGPMNLAWLPSTTEGYMVGDYIATSYSQGNPRTSFAVTKAPDSTGMFREAIYSPSVNLAGRDGAATAPAVPPAAAPTIGSGSDHAPAVMPLTSN
jgi:hypothetical protein